MTTLNQAKDVLFNKIADMMGRKGSENENLVSTINFFLNYLADVHQIQYVEEISEQILAQYRIFVRIFSDDQDELPLVCAVGAFLCVCNDELWLPESMLDTWKRLGRIELFPRNTTSLN